MAHYIGLYVLTFIVYTAAYFLIEYVFPEFEFSEAKFYKVFGYVAALGFLGGPYFLLGAPGAAITVVIFSHAIYAKTKG